MRTFILLKDQGRCRNSFTYTMQMYNYARSIYTENLLPEHPIHGVGIFYKGWYFYLPHDLISLKIKRQL